MPPGEENEEKLVDNIRIRDVEVMLEGRYVDITVKLPDLACVTI